MNGYRAVSLARMRRPTPCRLISASAPSAMRCRSARSGVAKNQRLGKSSHHATGGSWRIRTRRRSGRVVSGAGTAHGFIDDVLGHLGQFAVFGLADRPQLGERVLGAAPAASPDQADRLINHWAG
jgi:hypothetical protein